MVRGDFGFVLGALLCAVTVARPAAAQSPQTAPAGSSDRLSVSLNAGMMTARETNPRFRAPAFGGAVQRAMKPWLVLEGEVGRWSGSRHIVETNVPAFRPGVVVRIARVTSDDTLVGWNADGSVLFRTTGSRWRGFAGVGFGAVWQEYELTLTGSGCVPADSVFCGVQVTPRRTSGPVPGGIAQAGLEVRILPRAWVFAAIRSEGRGFDEIPAGQKLSRAVAGVRFVLR